MRTLTSTGFIAAGWLLAAATNGHAADRYVAPSRARRSPRTTPCPAPRTPSTAHSYWAPAQSRTSRTASLPATRSFRPDRVRGRISRCLRVGRLRRWIIPTSVMRRSETQAGPSMTLAGTSASTRSSSASSSPPVRRLSTRAPVRVRGRSAAQRGRVRHRRGRVSVLGNNADQLHRLAPSCRDGSPRLAAACMTDESVATARLAPPGCHC